MTASEVVQLQLDSYNAHDLGRFLSFYHDTIKIFGLPSNEVLVAGKEQLAALYGEKVFSVNGPRAELLGRMASGNVVVDHELVFGLKEKPFEAFATYEVLGGLIDKVWLFSVG